MRRRKPQLPPEPSSYTFEDRPSSNVDQLRFVTETTVWWRLRTGTGSTDGAYRAARLVRTVINAAAAEGDVLRADAAQQDIATALNAQLPLTDDEVEVLSADVRVTIDEPTRLAALRAEQRQHEFLRQAEFIRQDTELDDAARRQARARVDFLRTEILADPASARLYGLIEKSAAEWHRLGGPPADANLMELVDEVQRWRPDGTWVLAAKVLHDFAKQLSPQGSRDLLMVLASVINDYGDDTAAKKLTRLAEDPSIGGADA